MPPYSLNINGESISVDVDADTPLLWILREMVGLTGTKYSCGQGICGACTVLLDGSAVRSCILPVSEVGSQEITTIEGLSPSGDHPLQKAWLTEGVSQCG